LIHLFFDVNVKALVIIKRAAKNLNETGLMREAGGVAPSRRSNRGLKAEPQRRAIFTIFYWK